MKMIRKYVCPYCGSLNKSYNPKAFLPQTQCRNCGNLVDVTFEYGPARAMYIGIKDARIETTMGTLRDTFDLEYILIDENHFEQVAFVRMAPMPQGEEQGVAYKRMLSRMRELLVNNPDCIGVELNSYWMKEIK